MCVCVCVCACTAESPAVREKKIRRVASDVISADDIKRKHYLLASHHMSLHACLLFTANRACWGNPITESQLSRVFMCIC